jgi:hypothetical protein
MNILRRFVMKKTLSVAVIVLMLVLIGACKKKEEAPETTTPVRKGPIIDSPALPPDHKPRQKVELNVVVPPEVKDKWDGVKLIVEDKKLQKKQEFTVKLGGELKIPDSKLTIKVGDFLPEFKLGAQTITSVSNNPANPAVGITVFEDGQQVFPETGQWGWLYVKHPTIHPFQHERFRVLIKEGIAKK